MNKVVHLIPFDGVGGVERAAHTMHDIKLQDIDFDVWTIFPSVDVTKKWILWNPLHYIETISRLSNYNPDLLIVSLWRSYLVGCILKIFRPKLKIVVFLHLPNHVHFLDRIFTSVACYMAECIWADSEETMRNRLANLSTKKTKIISFVTEKIEYQLTNSETTPKPYFIFWGRLHPQKGLPVAIEIFRLIHEQQLDAQFTIIGPDGGDLELLKNIVKDNQLIQSVNFTGPKTFEEIKNEAWKASFYLQTSELEGMAMSVVEAMQLGLVPVVTQVGEIANYCSHLKNSIIVKGHQQAVDNVVKLLNDKSEYITIRSNAIETWRNKSLYKDDVIRACQELLI